MSLKLAAINNNILSFSKLLGKDGWLIFFYTIVMFVPIFRRNAFAILDWIWQTLPFCFTIAVLICITIRLIFWGVKGKNGLIIFSLFHALSHLFVYITSFVDVWLFTKFGLLINYTTLQLLLQSSMSETQEFLQTYLLDPDTFLVLLLFLSLGFIEYVVCKYFNNWNPFSFVWVKFLSIFYFILGLVGVGVAAHVLSAPDSIEADYRLMMDKPCINEHQFMLAFVSVWIALDNNSRSDRLRENIADTRVNSSTLKNDEQSSIVLIIGESHIKSHASLYGYELPTNPCLEKIRQDLYIFSDVITPINKTNEVLQCILSVASVRDSINWDDTTLFPAVFKSAGWNVSFCSNQITSRPGNSSWNASVTSYLNDPIISEACFTSRNDHIYKYDGWMVDSLLAHRPDSTDCYSPNLTIIQLMGQHVTYRERYPGTYSEFSVSDYKEKTNLLDFERQDIADYDNATRYNDEQIFKIIQGYSQDNAVVIYISDHGEEVNDYRSHVGRTYNLKKYAPMSYHYQMDVPFVVFLSKRFKVSHPDLVEQFEESLDKPFMTDDLCHLLFYLGDIDTDWFDQSKCLIHPEYAPTQRVLCNGDNYDEWVNKR